MTAPPRRAGPPYGNGLLTHGGEGDRGGPQFDKTQLHHYQR